MARWRGRNKTKRTVAIVFTALILLLTAAKYWIIVLIAAGVVASVLLAKWILEDKEQDVPVKQNTDIPGKSSNYSAKDSIMTDCEKAFFEAIKEIVGVQYTVQPQINLASVIDKESCSKYRNELFRNIDFGVFDRNYSLVLLIEINDPSHLRQDRSARDSKVREICESAGIPLVTFWTKYGINKVYMRDQLARYLPLIDG